MSDTTGIPIDVDEDVSYADVNDVNDVLRSFAFDTNTNPTQAQVERLLSKKTRSIEKQIPTAFRTLEISDLSISVEGSSKQSRGGNKVRKGHGVRQSGGLRQNTTTDRWIIVQLPHYFIQSLDSLTLKSSTGSREIDLAEDDDRYEINLRDGVLRVDYRYFPSTSSGTAGSDRLKDTRVVVDYTYGRGFIEEDITEATAKLAVYDLINSDAFSELRSDDDTFIDLEVFTERIEEDAEDILNHYKY